MADIYKRKRVRYSFEIYIGECTISLQGSILNHGLSLLRSSFRKGYIRNSSLRIWNMAKRRGRGDPRFPRRKIETREHLRLIAPLPDQSSRRGSNPHDFPLYISIIFRTIDQSMFIVFLLFSFAPGGSVVPLLFAF